MSLAAFAVEKKAVTYFATAIMVVAGFLAYKTLGQLEDPDYTVKTAVITTPYPGASPEEVELEVSDRIETKIQELKQIKWIESTSRAGVSMVKVEMLPQYWADSLPQVWDELRRKIREVETDLPPGAGRPRVFDDYGDVFGFQLALVGDGFEYADMERFAKDLRKELVLVKGVARVDLWGVQQKVIYVDALETQLTELGITDTSLIKTLQNQNMVVDGGGVELQQKRFRIAPTGEFRSPTDIGNLTIRPSLSDELMNLSGEAGTPQVAQRSSELIRIRDIGDVVRGYQQPPTNLMHYNGQPAVGLSITNIPGVNIVAVGAAIDERLDELAPRFPVGIELFRVHWQSDVVAEAINGFLINFAEAVAIVLVVLTVFMGWRMGLIIGTALVVTVLGTFVVMAIMGIDLQRMSLGALVISLGMMVDNAIVVADGMAVRVQQGMDRKQAAIAAASRPAWPLLAATIIAVMAFYPIYSSPESTGEYCATLFTVVAISLLLSWLVSMTLTPLQCIDMITAPKDGADIDPYAGGFYRKFRALLGGAIGARWLTLGIAGALLAVSLVGFGSVKQLFFPDSSMPKFMIDFYAPEGTRIQDVAAQLDTLDARLRDDERVDAVTAYVGSGPPRFYLPVEPEDPIPSYGQLVVNVHDFREIAGLIDELNVWVQANYPDALIPIRAYGVGPNKTWKFEVRISGPAIADAGTLRNLAGEVVDILDADPLSAYSRTDWRQRVQKVVPEYNQERARWSSISREDIANTTKRAFDGVQIGLYRERDDLMPIVLRHAAADRKNVANIPSLQVQTSSSVSSVPLSQVTDDTVLDWEDPIIKRRDRRRTIKVQSNPIPEATFPSQRASVLAALEAIELPPGYAMDWGGEFEDTRDSQAALIPGMIPAAVVILFLIVLLYNTFRHMLVIVLVIPFVVIGITWGLLFTGTPFGFMSLLGAMSLAGMMIKNAIVLLDEVNSNLELGKSSYDSVIDAATARLRPVALAAATTVLGVAPLLQDVFWVGMAVTIMSGLAVGTFITMILVPVLYCVMFRVKKSGRESEPESAATLQTA